MADVTITTFGGDTYVVVHDGSRAEPVVVHHHQCSSREEATEWLSGLPLDLTPPRVIIPGEAVRPGFHLYAQNPERYYRVSPSDYQLTQVDNSHFQGAEVAHSV